MARAWDDEDEALAAVAAEGLIFDNGKRRNGKIVWAYHPDEREEVEACFEDQAAVNFSGQPPHTEMTILRH